LFLQAIAVICDLYLFILADVLPWLFGISAVFGTIFVCLLFRKQAILWEALLRRIFSVAVRWEPRNTYLFQTICSDFLQNSHSPRLANFSVVF